MNSFKQRFLCQLPARSLFQSEPQYTLTPLLRGGRRIPACVQSSLFQMGCYWGQALLPSDCHRMPHNAVALTKPRGMPGTHKGMAGSRAISSQWGCLLRKSGHAESIQRVYKCFRATSLWTVWRTTESIEMPSDLTFTSHFLQEPHVILLNGYKFALTYGIILFLDTWAKFTCEYNTQCNQPIALWGHCSTDP